MHNENTNRKHEGGREMSEFNKYATCLDDRIRLGYIVQRFENAWEDPAKRKDVEKIRTAMKESFDDLERAYKERMDGMIRFYDSKTLLALKKVKK